MHFEYFYTVRMYFRLNVAVTKTRGMRSEESALLKKIEEKGSEGKKEAEEINVH